MNYSLKSLAAALFASSAVVIACSGSTTAGSSSGSASDSSAFVTQFCDLAAPCCSKISKSTDPSSCRTVYGALLTSYTYNAAKGSECLSAMQAHRNDADFCSTLTGESSSCDDAFTKQSTGSAAPGTACSDDSDCAPSTEGKVDCAYFYTSQGSQTRTCQVQIDGKAGDGPCSGTRDGNSTTSTSTSGSDDAGATSAPPRTFICDVANGVFCDGGKTCAALAPLGSPCSGSYGEGCVKGSFCDGTSKTCKSPGAVGSDCDSFSGNNVCMTGASCDQTTKKCAATLADGAACMKDTECTSRSCVNAKCEAGKSSDLQFVCGN